MSDISKVVNFDGKATFMYVEEQETFNPTDAGRIPRDWRNKVEVVVSPDFDNNDQHFEAVYIKVSEKSETKDCQADANKLDSWEPEDGDENNIRIHCDMIPTLIRALQHVHAVGTCCD